jgi:hypothetical protein
MKVSKLTYENPLCVKDLLRDDLVYLRYASLGYTFEQLLVPHSAYKQLGYIHLHFCIIYGSMIENRRHKNKGQPFLEHHNFHRLSRVHSNRIVLQIIRSCRNLQKTHTFKPTWPNTNCHTRTETSAACAVVTFHFCHLCSAKGSRIELSRPITINPSYLIALYRIVFVWPNDRAPKKSIESYRSQLRATQHKGGQ